MYQAVTDAFAEQDIVVMAAAVADYRPKTVADEKIKKPMVDWRWKWNARKIFFGNHFCPEGKPVPVGFSMETQHLERKFQSQVRKEKLDMIVANNLKTAGAGFGTDTNVVTLITESEEKEASDYVEG